MLKPSQITVTEESIIFRFPHTEPDYIAMMDLKTGDFVDLGWDDELINYDELRALPEVRQAEDRYIRSQR